MKQASKAGVMHSALTLFLYPDQAPLETFFEQLKKKMLDLTEWGGPLHSCLTGISSGIGVCVTRERTHCVYVYCTAAKHVTSV